MQQQIAFDFCAQDGVQIDEHSIPARHFVQRVNNLVEMGIGLSILGHPLKALFIVPTRVRFSQSSADRHWA
jgi:hypothetical protein